MKLKKLMALAMSGVLAVSMFAGCAKADVKPEDPTVPAPATNWSTTLGEKVDVEKDFVTYQANDDDQAALQDALGNLGSVSTGASAVLPDTIQAVDRWNNAAIAEAFGDSMLMINDFVDTLGIENTSLALENMYAELVNDYNVDANETLKVAVMYVIDGTVELDKALNQVADAVRPVIENLPNVNDDTADTRYTYDYIVSVSVENKPVSVIDWYNGSANFIAVTITRVPTAA